VLVELNLTVRDKLVSADGEWLFLIVRLSCPSPSVPVADDCYYLYSGVEDDPYIYEEEAAAIRRHFRPPSSKQYITTLGL